MTSCASCFRCRLTTIGGDARRAGRDHALEDSDLILLLVSADLLSSPYFTGAELARALERHRDGSAMVIPVILRPAAWTGPLGHLQVLPSDGRPISTATDRDEAHREVVAGVRRVLAVLRTRVSDTDPPDPSAAGAVTGHQPDQGSNTNPS